MGRQLAAVIALACLWAPAAGAKTVDTVTIAVTASKDLPSPEGAPLTSPLASPAPTAADAPADAETAEDAGERPQVLYSTDLLPKPVARMRSQLREAAINGDLNRLRMVLESNEMPPTLSFAESGDPIDFIKQSSGDGEGFEILAILADILDAGYVHVDVGTAQEMYVWPYFARYPLDGLTPDQKVELYRIVTAGDFAAMQDFGAWTFYRLGIGPDGTLHFFVAGD